MKSAKNKNISLEEEAQIFELVCDNDAQVIADPEWMQNLSLDLQIKIANHLFEKIPPNSRLDFLGKFTENLKSQLELNHATGLPDESQQSKAQAAIHGLLRSILPLPTTHDAHASRLAKDARQVTISS